MKQTMRIVLSLLFVAVASCAVRTKRNILPEKCGSNAPKSKEDGVNAGLGEFPWIVRLKYGDEGYFACNGFIVHEKFILTAAQCLTEYRELMNLTKIEIGEHDADKEKDCFEKTCAPQVQTVEFEDPIEHPDYDKREYDLALIPLKKAIKFNDYVSPICLTDDQSLDNYDPTTYTLGGWGRVPPEYAAISPVKQKVKEPLFDFRECQGLYEPLNITITDTHLCAAGEHTCSSVAGSPLMYLSGEKWYAVGIVSFGVNECEKTNIPTVYTNLHKVEQWILDTMAAHMKKST